MRIRYEGHACLRCIADSGEELVMDPPAEKYGYVLEQRRTDYITVSHEHEDHSATRLFLNAMLIPQVNTQIQAGAFAIRKIDSFHDDENGALRGNNCIYKVVADGVTLVHLGDLGHLPGPEIVEFAAGADVLAIPVGGVFTLEPEQAAEVIHLLKPHYAMPIHYGTPQSSLKQLCPLAKFLACWDGKVYTESSCEFTPHGHSGTDTQVLVMDYASRIL